jgi:hypothetical protein
LSRRVSDTLPPGHVPGRNLPRPDGRLVPLEEQSFPPAALMDHAAGGKRTGRGSRPIVGARRRLAGGVPRAVGTPASMARRLRPAGGSDSAGWIAVNRHGRDSGERCGCEKVTDLGTGRRPIAERDSGTRP